jgi:hypothetical protein
LFFPNKISRNGQCNNLAEKQKYLKECLEYALLEKERSGQPVKYGAKQKADIIVTACSNPPEGRARWTLELLSDTLKEKKGLSAINRKTIRLIKKNECNPWLKKIWCITTITQQYRDRR